MPNVPESSLSAPSCRLTDGLNHYTPNSSCPPSPWAIALPPKKDGSGEPAPTSAPESKPDSPLQQSLTVQICNDLVCSTQVRLYRLERCAESQSCQARPRCPQQTSHFGACLVMRSA